MHTPLSKQKPLEQAMHLSPWLAEQQGSGLGVHLLVALSTIKPGQQFTHPLQSLVQLLQLVSFWMQFLLASMQASEEHNTHTPLLSILLQLGGVGITFTAHVPLLRAQPGQHVRQLPLASYSLQRGLTCLHAPVLMSRQALNMHFTQIFLFFSSAMRQLGSLDSTSSSARGQQSPSWTLKPGWHEMHLVPFPQSAQSGDLSMQFFASVKRQPSLHSRHPVLVKDLQLGSKVVLVEGDVGAEVVGVVVVVVADEDEEVLMGAGQIGSLGSLLILKVVWGTDGAIGRQYAVAPMVKEALPRGQVQPEGESVPTLEHSTRVTL